MRRACQVCGQPIPTTDLRRVTCGSPRCRRERERRANYEKRPAPPQAEQLRPIRDLHAEVVRRDRTRVVLMMRQALDAGASQGEAIMAVSRNTGESIATVMAVWRAAT